MSESEAIGLRAALATLGAELGAMVAELAKERGARACAEKALERMQRIEGAKPPSAPRAPADDRVLPCHVSRDGLVRVPEDLRAALGVVNGGPVAFIKNRAGKVEILSEADFDAVLAELEAAAVDPGSGAG